jgi:hypothetical protein
MQILVVLVWLGVLTVLATWLAQGATWAVAGVGVLAAAVEPFLVDWSREWLAAGGRDPITVAAVDLAFSGPSYRLAAFVLPTCAGILLVRLAQSDRARLAVGAACVPVAGVIFLLDKTETALLEPYSGSLQELVFNTALALGVTSLMWVAAPRLSVLGASLAGAGALALTIYSLQIVGDWAFFKNGGTTDDQWSVLAVACVGALALGAAWLPVARATGWRGPLEGPVDLLARGRRSAR